MTARARYEQAWRRAEEIGVAPQLAELADRAVGELAAAEALYDELRWGKAPDGVVVLEAPAVYPGQGVTELGVLELVEYSGQKGRGRPYIWTHPFRRRKPLLCVTEDRRLVIVGGDYEVSERGIVG